jgi:hypothetical protein
MTLSNRMCITGLIEMTPLPRIKTHAEPEAGEKTASCRLVRQVLFLAQAGAGANELLGTGCNGRPILPQNGCLFG